MKAAYIPKYHDLFFETRATFLIINTDLKYIINRTKGWRSVLEPCAMEKATLTSSLKPI